MLTVITVYGPNNIQFTIELRTKDVMTHSLLSDYPDKYRELENIVRNKIQEIIDNDYKVR